MPIAALNTLFLRAFTKNHPLRGQLPLPAFRNAIHRGNVTGLKVDPAEGIILHQGPLAIEHQPVCPQQGSGPRAHLKIRTLPAKILKLDEAHILSPERPAAKYRGGHLDLPSPQGNQI